MIVNPFLDLQPVHDEGVIRAITVRAPVKGESLRVTTIDRDHDPDIFGFLVIYIYSGTKGAQITNSVTGHERERLTAIGFLVPSDQVPCPVSFSCDFDDVPANLLPLRAQRQSRSYAWHDDLIVDPTLHHLGKNAIMPEMRGYKLPNPFHGDRSWVSIEDGLSAPVFYSYTTDASASIDSLSSGQPVPKDLSSDVCQKLIEAGVLRFPADASVRRENRDRDVQPLTNRSWKGATWSCGRLSARFNLRRFDVTTES
jgi:hypothetical protein